MAWNGTQHNPTAKRKDNGVPRMPAGTLAVTGDLKQMKPDWLKGASFRGYGTSLCVGAGIPIPVLDEEMARFTSVRDGDILARIAEYGKAYPEGVPCSLGEVSYAELRSGKIRFDGRTIPAASLSSYAKAVEIASTLKAWIEKGDFLLSEPVAPLPGAGIRTRLRPAEGKTVKRIFREK